MFVRIIRMLGVLALLLPALVMAQGSRFANRAEIRVINDWSDAVTVTVIAERHDEMVRRTWDFAPGEGAFLAMLRDGEERRIRVRGIDRIKIKSDSRGVAIADVARYRNGHWFVKVRDVYRAQRARDESHRDNYRGSYR